MPVRCGNALSSCSSIFWPLGKLRKGTTIGSRISLRYCWEFKVLFNTFKSRKRLEENTPTTTSPSHSSLQNRAQLSIHQGGIPHGQDHLYDTDRYRPRLTKELSASGVVASYQPLSCRQFAIFTFAFLLACFS